MRTCASSGTTGCPAPPGSTSGSAASSSTPCTPGLCVELDGRAFHARRREMRADRHRDADLQALGFRVLRLVWEDLYDDQAVATIARLLRLMDLRGA